MLQNIIKRDGSIEKYEPQKLNMWGEWASSNISGDSIDWGDVVITAISGLPDTSTSVQLQDALVNSCLDRRTWEYNRMAGRLYSSMLHKQISNLPSVVIGDNDTPTIKSLHLLMTNEGLMAPEFINSFTDEEYEQINDMLDHSLDLTYPHYQLQQISKKYAIRHKKTDELYETPQYAYMRVAMRMCMNKENRIERIRKMYFFYSTNKINIPTPYFVNAGTATDSYSSCCVYTTNDTRRSLAIGDHIAYTMTYMSAGIGSHIVTRPQGAEIRGGLIEHRGKMNYYRSLVGAINANTQNGRGGSSTVTYNAFDPDWVKIQALKNPMTPATAQIRGLDYALAFNKFFMQKAAKGEDIALFGIDTAPEIYEHITDSADIDFGPIYDKAVADGKALGFTSAREFLLGALNQGLETGRHYYTNLTEMNTHTPFKDKIHQSNLCQEIAIPSKGYNHMSELYGEDENTDGEVGICSLAAVNLPNIKSDEEHAEAVYYCLLMIHTAIHECHYELPHIGVTSKARNSAGVGISGVAHYFAENDLKYDSVEGLKAIHEISESHYYHLVKASLKMSKEFGNAKWMHKTKWPEGWLPIDTYNKNVDSIANFEYKRDWESLRKEIIDNGGIHNSVLVAHMPAESSSISSGTTNSIYPIRGITLNKSNNDDSIAWIAPDSTRLARKYQNAYTILTENMCYFYAVIQKFTDQGISADEWKVIKGGDRIPSSELLKDAFRAVKFGVKSRYYINTKTAKDIGLGTDDTISDDDCAGCKI